MGVELAGKARLNLPALCLCLVAESWNLPAFLWNTLARILIELCTHSCELHKGTESWVVESPCYTMDSTPAEEEEKPAVEGERRRKILIAIASFSILLGFFMMVVGCVMLGQYNIFLLVIGIFTMVVSGTGVYAAVMQHFCLMTAFLAVMVAVVVLEILASVTFFALNNAPSMHANTNAMLKKTLQRYGSEGNPPASEEAWNLIQVELQCCGLSGPDDYPADGPLPTSCCSELRINVLELEECRKETPTLHTEGCQRAFRAFLGRKVGAIGAVSVIAALLQILVIYASS